MNSIKERFENHPVVFGSSLLLAGLIAGGSFTKFVLPPESQAAAPPHSISLECKVDGLPLLAESHDKRVLTMQGKILELEAKASDQNLISPYQDKYLESANRVRADIEIENNLFNKSIERLLSNCKASGS